MPRNPKPCKVCNQLGHTQFYCRQKKRKRIDPKGKQYKKWQETRERYLAPKTELLCYICKKPLTKETATLDHVKPKGSHPELRHDENNLQVCCWQCNGDKGSQSYEAYLKRRRIGVSGKSSMQ